MNINDYYHYLLGCWCNHPVTHPPQTPTSLASKIGGCRDDPCNLGLAGAQNTTTSMHRSCFNMKRIGAHLRSKLDIGITKKGSIIIP